MKKIVMLVVVCLGFSGPVYAQTLVENALTHAAEAGFHGCNTAIEGSLRNANASIWNIHPAADSQMPPSELRLTLSYQKKGLPTFQNVFINKDEGGGCRVQSVEMVPLENSCAVNYLSLERDFVALPKNRQSKTYWMEKDGSTRLIALMPVGNSCAGLITTSLYYPAENK